MIFFDKKEKQMTFKCKGLVHLLAFVFDGAFSDVIFRWTTRITSEEWLFLVFVEVCRLKGVTVHVVGNVGVDYLKVLKKDTEQRVKRSAKKTEYL